MWMIITHYDLKKIKSSMIVWAFFIEHVPFEKKKIPDVNSKSKKITSTQSSNQLFGAPSYGTSEKMLPFW